MVWAMQRQMTKVEMAGVCRLEAWVVEAEVIAIVKARAVVARARVERAAVALASLGARIGGV